MSKGPDSHNEDSFRRRNVARKVTVVLSLSTMTLVLSPLLYGQFYFESTPGVLRERHRARRRRPVSRHCPWSKREDGLCYFFVCLIDVVSRSSGTCSPLLCLQALSTFCFIWVSTLLSNGILKCVPFPFVHP